MPGFEVPLDETASVSEVSVPSPQYVYVDLTGADDDDYFLELTVESEDDVCGMVSVQPMNLPVSDTADVVESEGSFQTMLEVAAFNVDRHALDGIGEGALVVFLVLPLDSDCRTEVEDDNGDPMRTKSFTFKLGHGVEKKDVWWLWGSCLILLAVLSIGTFLVSHFFSVYRQDRYSGLPGV